MKNGLTLVLIAIALFPFVGHADTACVRMNRTLQLGAKGADVRYLQQYLNSDASTRIATSGKGSPGKETGVFDKATKNAVERLQEANKELLLLPAGLTKPSGIVGSLTRKFVEAWKCDDALVSLGGSGSEAAADKVLGPSKRSGEAASSSNDDPATYAQELSDRLAAMNKHYEEEAAKIVAMQSKYATFIKEGDRLAALQKTMNTLLPSLSSGVLTGTAGANQPSIDLLLPQTLCLGDTMGVVGSKYTHGNGILIDGVKIATVDSVDEDDALQFVVPQTLSLGKHHLSISNENGVSPSVDFTVAAHH